MMHLLAFAGAKTDSTNNENAPAVADQGINSSSNGRFILPADVRAVYATIMNDTITRARLTAPSLRNEGLPEIHPVTVSNAPATNPIGAYWGEQGPLVRKNEEFGLESSNGASTIDRVHSLVLIRDRVEAVKEGRRMTIFGSSTITLVQDAWALGTITLDQTLPVGRFQVIGMHAWGTNCYGARLVFPRNGFWRPGCPAAIAVGGFEQWGAFRAGRLGAWGEFDQVAQPQLEAIGHTAGASTISVYLDLVKISDQIGT